MRRAWLTAAAAAALLPVIAITACSLTERPIPREDLVEDVERLAWIIEDAHPDPYTRGGGKDAFDARLAEVLAGIPEDGMSTKAFARHIKPFVAAIGDAHTDILTHYDVNWSRPGGVPLYFDVVEDGLYVLGVTREEDRRLIGARLVAIEGVPLDEIKARLLRVQACENDYGMLSWLHAYGYLWTEPQLAELLPEWTDHDRVSVTLRHVDGSVSTETLEVPGGVDYPPIYPGSRMTLPDTEKCDFAYSFLDPERKVALLRIDGMMHYREAAEMWHNMGVEQRESTGREAYRRFHGSGPPSDYEDVLAGIPSVTETFTALVTEMKEAGTELLMVDLRRNDGGNSYMSNVLVYFLYGEDVLQSREPGLEVKKYSSFYFETYPNESLEQVNEGREVPLEIGDSDTLSNPRLGVTPELLKRREDDLRLMTTFERELDSGEYDGYYLPQRVMVLCSQRTFSSGYTMMRYLFRTGAELVGTPSGQASNCFGDILEFRLENSRVRARVSHKRYEDFPGDPVLGRMLPMDHQLTYEKLSSYGFDTNAEVYLALEAAGFGALADSLSGS